MDKCKIHVQIKPDEVGQNKRNRNREQIDSQNEPFACKSCCHLVEVILIQYRVF